MSELMRRATKLIPMVCVALVVALLAGLVAGCGGCRKPTNARPRIAVSIFPIYDLARTVAGPDADVMLLLPAGRNEHHFDPTPKEIEEVASSQLGVMVGLGLDAWMEKLMKDAAPAAKVLRVGDRVPTLTIKDEHVGEDLVPEHHDEDPEVGAVDPHVWLDPARARLVVKAIAEDIARVDAAHAIAYRQRAADLDAKLEALDKEVDAKVATWKTRDFVTFHGSFGYFADRYHLRIVAVIEPFPGSTPTGQYIEAVLKVVKEKKVTALFSEPQLDARPANTIAEAAHVPLGVLDPVGGGPETDTYEKMIRFDVAALERVMK